MKKLSLVLVTLVAVSCMVLTSCNKDKLDGTTWAGSTIDEDGDLMNMTISFNEGLCDFMISYPSYPSASGSAHGTYTYSDPNVTIMANGTTLSGTVNKTSMTLMGGGISIVLSKR